MLVDAAQDAARLSEVRFKAGTTDYLEVLTNDTNYFSAELTLAQVEENELTLWSSSIKLWEVVGNSDLIAFGSRFKGIGQVLYSRTKKRF